MIKDGEIAKRNLKEELELEKETLKRLRKKSNKVIKEKERKISKYLEVSNNIFHKTSEELSKKAF